MDKVFRIMEIGLVVVMLLVGIASIIAGLITGMFYCFVMGACAFALPYVWYVEDYKSKGKSLWQKRNIKN